MSQKKVLVVSAHAVDFVWRAGGTIANYAKTGHKVKIIDLSYGARGESESLWKENKNISEEEVKKIRRKEAEDAAKVLCADIDFYDIPDHLLILTKDDIRRLASDMMDFQPDIILTHSERDLFNPDHDNAHQAVLAAARSANVSGVFPNKAPTRQCDIYLYEVDTPEPCHFSPDIYIDITDVFEIKKEAMSKIPSQAFMAETYSHRSRQRGILANKFRKGIKYAETFQRICPFVGKSFDESLDAAMKYVDMTKK
jgi:4-oxalomesaconate hydratase